MLCSPSSSVIETTDHADPGICVFHPAVTISTAPCSVCLAALRPLFRPHMPDEALKKEQPDRLMECPELKREFPQMERPFLAWVHGPSAIEEGDQANDHRPYTQGSKEVSDARD